MPSSSSISPPADGAPEFSHPVSTARLGFRPSTYRLVANAEERAALARRFNLLTLDRFEAVVTLARQPGDAIRLHGEITAELVQPCIVTLEPVPEQVRDIFTLIYRPDIDEATADQMALDNPEDEIIEPLIGDSIDIGEAVAQQLSVAMEPYPRAVGAQTPGAAPDVAFEGEEAGAPMARPNPFDALAVFKKPG